MAVEELLETTQPTNALQLKDQLVSKIVKLGCACATDLAGEIGGRIKPKDLVEPLNSLVDSGVLRRKKDKDDPREYNECQIVYELAAR
jgi:hypothetical protein